MASQPEAAATPARAGATTRQRTGKTPQSQKTKEQPRLAPRPISKSKKAKKKGKQPAAKKTVMTLYGFHSSSCSWRVRLALALKGFQIGKDVEYVPVDLKTGQQKTENYAKINPVQVRLPPRSSKEAVLEDIAPFLCLTLQLVCLPAARLISTIQLIPAITILAPRSKMRGNWLTPNLVSSSIL